MPHALTHVLATPYLAIVLVLAASPARAQQSAPAPSGAKAIDCAMATATPELNACAEIRLKKADDELAAAVKKARERIGKIDTVKPEDRPKWLEALETAQKVWGKYREADCKGAVPYEWQGGTGTTLAVLECMAQMAEQRGFELGERYSESR